MDQIDGGRSQNKRFLTRNAQICSSKKFCDFFSWKFRFDCFVQETEAANAAAQRDEAVDEMKHIQFG